MTGLRYDMVTRFGSGHVGVVCCVGIVIKKENIAIGRRGTGFLVQEITNLTPINLKLFPPL
jgi:hypothetical protein